jgi:hypothetical protein
MDRTALDWLFSTAPQAIAALVGLIFTGVTFFISALDKEVSRDETKEDICEEMKKDIHTKMQWLYWLAEISVVFDMLILVVNPVDENKIFSFNGTFDWYLLFDGIVLLLNLVTVVFSLWFIVRIANPKYLKQTANRMLGVVQGDVVEVKEYVAAFIEMEKTLKDLPLNVVYESQQTHRSATVSDILRELRYKDWLSQQDISEMYRLNRLRNAAVHGENVESIENSDCEKVKEYTDKLRELRSNL